MAKPQDTPVASVSIEPEEIAEAALVAFLGSRCSIPVHGALAPSSEGVQRVLAVDTYVYVTVDQLSQDGDYRGPYVPYSFDVQINVRFAQCDDKSGHDFRDECRIVRGALTALTGDGCTAISSPLFECDSFMLGRTTTTHEQGENPLLEKAYSATLKGRTINMTEAH